MAELFGVVSGVAFVGGCVAVAGAALWLILQREWRQLLLVLAGGLVLLGWPLLSGAVEAAAFGGVGAP